MPATAHLEPFTVNLRIKISALWTSMLLVFVYVDLFSFYRPDFRAAVEAGTVGGFSVNQAFLLGTTAYIVVPTVMIFATLVLRPRASRYVNIALSSLYALTIVIAAIGEWNYYVLGSALEVVALAAIVYYAWTWPKLVSAKAAAEGSADTSPVTTRATPDVLAAQHFDPASRHP